MITTFVLRIVVTMMMVAIINLFPVMMMILVLMISAIPLVDVAILPRTVTITILVLRTLAVHLVVNIKQ
jgi:hypothetical protein